MWKGEHKGREVAAKALRVYTTNDFERIIKVRGTRLVVFPNELTIPIQWFCKEVIIWKTLHHPNVLPLLGVTMSENPHRFVMVSEWMENGNINRFLQRVDADRLKLVRVLL